ncbi:MAG TPA: tetratricopeptide repeat protein [Chryseosolibacter sp.]
MTTFPKGLMLLMMLAIAPVVAWSQGSAADSLEQTLMQAEGHARVDVLNRLVYEYISVDNAKVVRYSDEALKLARQLKYVKGEGIAYAYRGVYDYMSGEFRKAHDDLHRALALSTEARDTNTVGYAYLQLGTCGLEEVNTDSAYIYFTKAKQVFNDSTNPESLSKVYRNMSALFGQRFQPDSQQYYLQKAIAIRRLLPDKSWLIDALALQANLKVTSGDLVTADGLLREADELLKRYPNDLENLNDVRHIRALMLFQQGKFEEAVVLFDSARNYYWRLSHFRKYITLLTDLGKIFSDRGEYELALNNLYEALRLSQAKGYETETYIIRTRIGWVNFHLGDLQQALRLANESLNSRPSKLLIGDLSKTLTLKGVVLTDLNQFAEARVCLDSVKTIYQKAGNLHGLSETFMNFGTLEAKLSNYSRALELYQESIALAEQVNYLYGKAWSNWGIGDIYFRMKNYSKASSFLDRSEAASRRIGANEILIRNYKTRRDLLTAQGRFKEALEYSVMASSLEDSIHKTDLARRFVNLEKVQAIEERDRNIEVLQKDKQLAEDKIALQESRIRQQYILIVAGLISIGLLATLVFIYYRFYSRIRSLNVMITEKNRRIEAQSHTLQEVNQELNRLYFEVSEQNEEIQAQANKLVASNRSITDLNRDLEKLISEKTVELRKTNEELVKYNNELLQFSYTVSHNLRGPVARVLGLSSLLQNEQDVAQAKQWVTLISKTALELDTIIKDLGKILELRHEPQRFRETIEIADEWRQSVSLLQDSLRGDEQIISDFQSLPELTTVRPMLQSILYNLLSNAIKFRSPDRSLVVRATSRAVDSKAIIEVVDNGLGFNTEQHKDKIFRLYTRFHSHVEGRGLGLYLIKSQVDVLHGEVEVQSQPGVGTRFRIILPIIKDEVNLLAKA